MARSLNLGILAHVDAGKTTLTERLLYAAGVIGELGSVDHGTTQTDFLPLERQRGITIKSAVVSFVIDDVVVNLVDTPGHPDFIAEVERALSILDGAVLVVSAVEAVQPQTRILMRALRRLLVPTLVFVNKIDRAGADDERVLHAIAERLTPAIIAMGSTHGLGSRAAGFVAYDEPDTAFAARLLQLLAEHDDSILAAYVNRDVRPSYRALRRHLAVQTQAAVVSPVFFGSAITGAGVAQLMAGIAELLPAADADAEAADSLSARAFKIERGRAGEKAAYIRVFSGALHVRDRVRYGERSEGKVTAIEVFTDGAARGTDSVSAGQIAKVRGLRAIRVGDAVGSTPTRRDPQFGPPTLETVVVPVDPSDKGALRVALAQLAEQDPLINVSLDDSRQEISISIYGEVQKEVIAATLADEFAVDVTFRATTTLYVERPLGRGSALELLQDDLNPLSATIGLRAEPGPTGGGAEFRLDVDTRSVPTHIYKTAASFVDHMTAYVERALEEGLHGWRVTDVLVTLTDCGYYASDGPRKPTRPTARTTAADFRKLTPIVLRRALEQAGTVVCEPMTRASIETPTDSLGSVLALLSRLGGVTAPPSPSGGLCTIEAVVPAAGAQELRRQLPGITAGEGVVEADFAGYEPVSGVQPRKRGG